MPDQPKRPALHQLMICLYRHTHREKSPEGDNRPPSQQQPTTNRTTPAMANPLPYGTAPARQLPATNTPAATLTMITTHNTRNVLRSCFSPVLLRPRRVSDSEISET